MREWLLFAAIIYAATWAWWGSFEIGRLDGQRACFVQRPPAPSDTDWWWSLEARNVNDKQ